MSETEARKAAKDFAKQHLQGKTFINEQTGWSIIVSGNGIDHALRVGRDYATQEQAEVIGVLGTLLEKSIKGETE